VVSDSDKQFTVLLVKYRVNGVGVALYGAYAADINLDSSAVVDYLLSFLMQVKLYCRIVHLKHLPNCRICINDHSKRSTNKLNQNSDNSINV